MPGNVLGVSLCCGKRVLLESWGNHLCRWRDLRYYRRGRFLNIQVDERVLRGLILLASAGLLVAGIQLFEMAVIAFARALGRC